MTLSGGAFATYPKRGPVWCISQGGLITSPYIGNDHAFVRLLIEHPIGASPERVRGTPPYAGTPTLPPDVSNQCTQVWYFPEVSYNPSYIGNNDVFDCLLMEHPVGLSPGNIRATSPFIGNVYAASGRLLSMNLVWYISQEKPCYAPLYEHAYATSRHLLPVHPDCSSHARVSCHASLRLYDYAVSRHLLPVYPGCVSLGRHFTTAPYIGNDDAFARFQMKHPNSASSGRAHGTPPCVGTSTPPPAISYRCNQVVHLPEVPYHSSYIGKDQALCRLPIAHPAGASSGNTLLTSPYIGNACAVS